MIDVMRRVVCYFTLPVLLFLGPWAPAQTPIPLSGTSPLTLEGDLSARMVEGIDRFLLREIEQSITARESFWTRDSSSRAAYEKSVQPNRERLARIIGAVDTRLPVNAIEYLATTASPAQVAASERFTAHAVRWPVFEGVFGEGLLLEPRDTPVARVIAIPDADQTPEMIAGLSPSVAPESQFARRLAEHGCQVLVLTLVDRQDTWSGNERLRRFTNQPHREWIYRQAFELGRHIIGYEVQKVRAAVDWMKSPGSGIRNPDLKVGVAGYGEGGLIAFYAAAVDTRIDAAWVSGYFTSRQRVWEEPIYRNVFGLLREFGDAEIASLIAPRPLFVEYSEVPAIDGPPRPRPGRGGAAPGRWATPAFETVDLEVIRANGLVSPLVRRYVDFYHHETRPLPPGCEPALRLLLHAIGSPVPRLQPPGPAPVPTDPPTEHDTAARQRRQGEQLVQYTQKLLRLCEYEREVSFWKKLEATSAEAWQANSRPVKEFFWDDVIGRFPSATLPAHPRSRKIHDEPAWTGYDVVLDVWPDVFAWGVLLVPKDLKPDERRPVVVCQHGLEGVPADTITANPQSGAYRAYKGFAARLAERGFVVFAPHNPYRGGDAFRTLQRKANALGKSLFSIILAQHERILEWLGQQPFVNPERIAFYGLSYGGKTAMRVPALLEGYCLSICSADFNEWVKKNATVDAGYSYLFTGEYEIFEWDLGHTFNYAEMAALIAPRPFMVERGHHDGVAPDEWVAYEYAKVRRFYARLGIPDRTEIEFFNGPHTINGVGTFRFLHRHLNWPEAR